MDSEGRTIWIVDAHRDNGKRFVVRSNEMLSAFLELERITHELALSALLGADNSNVYEISPRKDRDGFDLISDCLQPFRLASSV